MLLNKNDNIAALEADTEEKDIMSDMRYICKSCALITEALQKGCDVMQMPNGDIIVSELKTITFQYTWDDKRGKLTRTQVGHKHRKPRFKRAESELSEFESDTEMLEEEFSIKETV